MGADSTGASLLCSSRFSHEHQFSKPNDAPALELMNEAARAVLREFKGHITMAFGESDEYRHVFVLTQFPDRPRLYSVFTTPKQARVSYRVYLHRGLRLSLGSLHVGPITGTTVF